MFFLFFLRPACSGSCSCCRRRGSLARAVVQAAAAAHIPAVAVPAVAAVAALAPGLAMSCSCCCCDCCCCGCCCCSCCSCCHFSYCHCCCCHCRCGGHCSCSRCGGAVVVALSAVIPVSVLPAKLSAPTPSLPNTEPPQLIILNA